jgi:hypothetical protein
MAGFKVVGLIDRLLVIAQTQWAATPPRAKKRDELAPLQLIELHPLPHEPGIELATSDE